MHVGNNSSSEAGDHVIGHKQCSLVENNPPQGPGDSAGASTSSSSLGTPPTHASRASVLGDCLLSLCRATAQGPQPAGSHTAPVLTVVPTVGCPSRLRSPNSCQLHLRFLWQHLPALLTLSETPRVQQSFVLVCTELGELFVPRSCPVVAARDEIQA